MVDTCYVKRNSYYNLDSHNKPVPNQQFFNVRTLNSNEENKRYIFRVNKLLAADKISKFKVEDYGEVKWELRESPSPIRIGSTTDWIRLYGSHTPRYSYVIEPTCEEEPKLEFITDIVWDGWFI